MEAVEDVRNVAKPISAAEVFVKLEAKYDKYVHD
jgi:hypothetical protein